MKEVPKSNHPRGQKKPEYAGNQDRNRAAYAHELEQIFTDIRIFAHRSSQNTDKKSTPGDST